MDFIYGGSVVLGTCLNLSESGLRGTLSMPVEAGTEGLLTLYHQQHSVALKARVDSLQKEYVRIIFEFETGEERSALQAFVKQFSEPLRA